MPEVLLKFNTTTWAKASDPTTIPIKEGQFLIVTDKKKLTYDFDGMRLTLGDIEEITSRSTLLNPVDKFYYETSTGILWRYTSIAPVGEKWKSWKNSDELDEHLLKTLADVDGVHGMKYNPINKTLYYYDADNDEWKPVLTGGYTSFLKTLTAGMWDTTNKTYTLTVSGLDSYSTGIVGLADDISENAYQAASNANLRVASQSEDTLVIKAYGDIPTIDIPIQVTLFLDTISTESEILEKIGDLADLTTSYKHDLVGSINEVNNDKLSRVTALPAASASYLNTQYLYVGEDNNNLVKGTIYECQSDGESTPSYSWVSISSSSPIATLIQTLVAGQTTLTFTDSSITQDATYDIYTDTYGVAPTNINTTNGEMIMTFNAQLNNVSVKLIIR